MIIGFFFDSTMEFIKNEVPEIWNYCIEMKKA